MAIENLDMVERAFVHVDYSSRSIDEHDWRNIQQEPALAAISPLHKADASAQVKKQYRSLDINTSKKT